ncbi:MAG: arsenate reductase ArsC [Flavobacteriales bacterium]|nr:arsenate reductase ArsC [Flavobacteriales bacterium]MCB9174035.1 arsenate reductase ArsC [Flavobacteriales bacterium]
MKKVVFVCVENSCRSQMAEAFGRLHGKGIIEVYSSGSRPSGIVNPKAIASMAEVGYDLSKHNSIGLDELPQINWDYAITMGCGDECPMIKANHREDWGLPDPKHMEPKEFAQVRDIIEREVMDLIEEIKKEKS